MFVGPTGICTSAQPAADATEPDARCDFASACMACMGGARHLWLVPCPSSAVWAPASMAALLPACPPARPGPCVMPSSTPSCPASLKALAAAAACSSACASASSCTAGHQWTVRQLPNNTSDMQQVPMEALRSTLLHTHALTPPTTHQTLLCTAHTNHPPSKPGASMAHYLHQCTPCVDEAADDDDQRSSQRHLGTHAAMPWHVV